MKKKKTLLNCIFVLICFVLTLHYVFKDQNLTQVFGYVRQARSDYWLAGVALVIAFILSESVIIWYMMRSLKQTVRLDHCFLYSFVGFFFSLVTPSATGGQPVQILFMKKDKLPIHLSTLVLLIVTITYKLVLVIIGALVLIIRPAQIMNFLRPAMAWIWLGIFLNVICISAMLALVFCPQMAKRLVMGCFRLLKRFVSERKIAVLERKLERSMESYGKASMYFAANKRVIFNVLAITFLQRIFLFSITYLVLLSFGVRHISMLEIVILQAMISMAVDMLPLPGGMGISEHLFQMIFLPVCGAALTMPAMIVSRGISFYTQLLISAVFTAAAYFIIFRGKEE
ncbi:lysylphosphatidylglycerol synthase transmembrane domain-containing protein [Ihubacter sp. rT4E-8]|uniref:lysylphosphatidylglycerol synthase transmembrane domain-containing protein n=1 Tax=Ihubacter sp. rT4E-8 TaxID=3242369 RepID=UPI003CF1063F